MESAATDEALIRAIIKRNSAAFEQLLARYRQVIHRHVEGMIRDQTQAEDLTQEVFWRVWTRADSWDGRGSLKAWLFRIATNQALNHLRAQRRRREEPLNMDSPASSVDDAYAAADSMWPADLSAQGPEAWVALAEQHAELRRAIEKLPPGKADVVRLMYEQDLTPHEMAEVMGIPQGTVRSRLFHARRQLSGLWQDLE